jgi:hypothetical protein
VVELYIAAGRNNLYAEQGRASANDEAARVKALFQADIDLTNYYNHTLLDGKWDHMMDQTHIGYTYWQEPPNNSMPAVREIELPDAAAMDVDAEALTFDVFNKQRRYIDVYNKGKTPFDFTATASAPWIVLSAAKGRVEKQQRLWVSVNWAKAPAGTSEGMVKIVGAGSESEVKLTALNPREITPATLRGFVEADGYVSIEAEHYSKNTAAGGARWEKIPGFGRTLSAMSVFPVDTASKELGAASPSLEYRMYLFHAGKADVNAILGPTQNFVPGRGLRFAMAFDDQSPQTIDALEHNTQRDWEETVKEGVRHVKASFTLARPGYHTLRIWMIDPGIVLERLVVDLGGVEPSYLGPPESYHSGVAE